MKFPTTQIYYHITVKLREQHQSCTWNVVVNGMAVNWHGQQHLLQEAADSVPNWICFHPSLAACDGSCCTTSQLPTHLEQDSFVGGSFSHLFYLLTSLLCSLLPAVRASALTGCKPSPVVFRVRFSTNSHCITRNVECVADTTLINVITIVPLPHPTPTTLLLITPSSTHCAPLSAAAILWSHSASRSVCSLGIIERCFLIN